MGLLGYIFLAPLGWIYLHIRYRDSRSVRQALDRHYNNSYAMAGSEVILAILLSSFLILVAALIAVTIYSMVKHGID